jgi:CDP-diacylglycerol--glycerol-3-phosphate 3-phosphatidyltransferase
MHKFRDKLHLYYDLVMGPVARLLVRLKVTPNQVSIVGGLFNVAAAAFIINGNFVLAGSLYFLAGGLDLLDGLVARLSGQETMFGAFLDSTLDRVSEGVVFAAIVYHLATGGDAVASSFVVLALLASLMVSYLRAKAEAMGIECKVGVMARLERVVLISAGLMFGFLPVAIYLLVVLTTFTVAQRFIYIFAQLQPERRERSA